MQAAAPGPVKLGSGLVLLAQPAPADAPRLPLDPGLKPPSSSRAPCEIEQRYGEGRREWVSMEPEYPGGAAACAREG